MQFSQTKTILCLLSLNCLKPKLSIVKMLLMLLNYFILFLFFFVNSKVVIYHIKQKFELVLTTIPDVLSTKIPVSLEYLHLPLFSLVFMIHQNRSLTYLCYSMSDG